MIRSYEVNIPPNVGELQTEIRTQSLGSTVVELTVIENLSEIDIRRRGEAVEEQFSFTVTDTIHGASPVLLGYVDGDNRRTGRLGVKSVSHTSEDERPLEFHLFEAS